jgi:hypothetical protein
VDELEGARREAIQATRQSLKLSGGNADINRRMARAYRTSEPLLPDEVLGQYAEALRDELASLTELAEAVRACVDARASRGT